MQYIILTVILILTLIILTIISGFNVKKLKALRNDRVLDEMVRRFPSNIQICQYILRKLGNEHTKIKEDKNSKTNLYVVATDTIYIANIKDTYTRVQTVAHECLHSIQNKNILWFNFIYSNILIISYILISILTIAEIIKNGILFCSILLVMTIIFYFVRSYLEMDAMVKAKFLAKEYIKDNKLTSDGNIEIIIKEYEKVNNIAIRAECFSIICNQIIKIIIYSVICCIFIK